MAHIALALESVAQRSGGSGDARAAAGVWHCDESGAPLAASTCRDIVARVSAALTAPPEGLALPPVKPGDRVALLAASPPQAELFAALLAATDAGALAAPLNARWSAAELRAALTLLEPSIVFVDAACAPNLAAVASAAAAAPLNAPRFAVVLLTPLRQAAASGGSGSSSTAATAALADAARRISEAMGRAPACTLSDLARSQQQQRLAAVPAQSEASSIVPTPRLQLRAPGDGGALIVFTSGTTGAPRGAVLPHSALLHQSMAKLAAVGYASSDAYLHTAPLCHVGGLSSALAALAAGAAHVFMGRGVYSGAEVVRLVRRHSVTAFIAVPAMVDDAVAAVGARGVAAGSSSSGGGSRGIDGALTSVKRVLVGGGGMQPWLASELRALCPNAAVFTAYGMTEASSSMTFMRLGGNDSSGSPPVDGAVCVGTPGPGIQVAILPSTTTMDAATTVGEVVTRGPHLMLGYWRDAGATNSALLACSGNTSSSTAARWLRTGDLGALDARGRLWLVGRAKDAVKSGGENVAAAEVERALEAHAGVAAAAVVGLPHARLGELVAAAVVLRPGWKWVDGDDDGSSSSSSTLESKMMLTAAILQEHCRMRVGLTPFKLPRRIVAVPELPRNTSGKLVKPAVRRLMLSANPRSSL